MLTKNLETVTGGRTDMDRQTHAYRVYTRRSDLVKGLSKRDEGGLVSASGISKGSLGKRSEPHTGVFNRDFG